MPRRRTHQNVGLIAGAAWAAYQARDEIETDLLLEVLGGAIGGWLASTWPDVLDPPSTPRHRDLFHSVVILAVVLLVSLDQQRQQCRDHARNAAQRAGHLQSARICAVGLRILAGAISGIQAGYASHLVLDGTTRESLPLVVNGF